MKLQGVIGEVQQVDGVIDVHDVHIWSLGPEVHALSCHVLIEDMPPSASDAILKRINRVLCEAFHIHHTTIQFEHVRCALAESGCSMPVEMHRHQH
jgi:cobalt-zinc-cadmium efflux system protein